MVDLELYRIFKVVAEEENITHASEKLNISQPAVTKHIQNLEEILNIKLFERTNKGLILTKIGKDIYDEIREPIGILENLYKKYSDSRDINLGIHTTMLNKLFSKKLSKYYELNENAKINIVNYDVVYEAGSIFSRSNNTSQPIDFTYSTSSQTSVQTSINGSSSIALKASGKIDAVSLGLESSVRTEIGVKKTVSFEESVDFTVKIMPNKKVSLLVKGNAILSNGASKYYFLGICTKKNFWEYVDVMSEYYELYEETITY